MRPERVGTFAPERQPNSIDLELAEFVSQFYADPLGFVKACYPWGEPGQLQDYDGPDSWQVEFLKGIGEEVRRNKFNGVDAVAPIRRAVSSGHGIGKSTIVAWLVDWIMSTRPHCQGTVTANTFTQLETKTWSSIQRWTKLCLTAHWFNVTSTRMYHVDHKESWYCSPQSSKEENSEAFAGQHASTSTSFYVFDEDSAIPNNIHEVAEGGLTDGEPMIFVFGNPTRNNGHFFEACFGRARSRWNPTLVDSRNSKFTNKTQIDEWISDYGIDSDFVRVRVRGMPPAASDAQFIDHNRVLEAQKRIVVVFNDEPLIAGADLAWGGGDDNVIRFRRGLDAKSIPPVRIKGEFTRDPAVLTTRLADVLTREYDGRKVDMLFLDSAGIAGPIAERLRQQGHRNVQEVNFGSDSPDIKCRYMRDYMWWKMKEWLLKGSIDNSAELEADLTGPGMRNDNRQRVWLESKETMKKRGVDSPDDGDALCLEKTTLISTPTGPVRIDALRVGDLVDTPFGPSSVEIIHRSICDRITSTKFSNGAELVGKGSHEIFTFDGPRRLDALSLTNEVEVHSQWRNAIWRLVSLPFMVDGSIGFKAQAHIFKAGTRQTRSAFFTAGCGRILMGLYQKVSRSITKMAIGATMPSRILNFAAVESTNANTWSPSMPIQDSSLRISNTSRLVDGLLPSGMDLKSGSLGTANMGSGHGLNESQPMLFAFDAGMATGHSSLAGRSTAPSRANRQSHFGAISAILASAFAAVRSLLLTAIGLRPIVPVRVQTEAVKPTEVFNLTLREHNAYYANGVLVFNCLTFASPVVSRNRLVMSQSTMPSSWGWN